MIALLWALACTPEAPRGETLTVLAASSLTEVFGELAPVYEAAHPGVEVVLSFAGSQALASQVRHGLQADVLASADHDHLAALAAEGLAEAPRPFAHNRLVLAASPGTAEGLSLETLPTVGSLVLGSQAVPVGRYTSELLDAATRRYGLAWRDQVEARVVSREPNTRLVLAKVALGEADAAIVYATDLAAAEGVRAVALPDDLAPTPACFHARLASASPDRAQAWLDLVEGPEGRAVLAARGFELP